MSSGEEQLRMALAEMKRQQNEMQELLGAFRAVLEYKTFEEAARRIFDACCRVTGAVSGYVALLSAGGDENEVLFLESGGMPCSVDPGLPMFIRGLRAEAYKEAAVVYENDFMNSRWARYLPAGHVKMNNVMFVPLTVNYRVVGLIGLANKAGDFTEDDATIAAPLGDIAAIALSRAWDDEKLRKSEEKYRKLAESTEAILWEFDIISNRWTYVAPQVTRVLGYLSEEWTDLQFWVDRIHPEDRDWAVKYCLGCTERGEEHTFEYRFLKKSGEFAWLRDVVSVEMQDGQAVKLRGFMLDITSSKEAQQKIAEYNRELEELYSRLDKEIDKARQIHERTILAEAPKIEGISMAAHYQPAQKMGGDFYDIINVKRYDWILDMNFRFSYLSPSVEHLLGYSGEEALALPLHKILTPQSRLLLFNPRKGELY